MFNEYFAGNSIWVMPIIVSAPIVLTRFAEIQKIKKEQEIKERYGIDEIPKEPKQTKKSSWENMSHGE